VELHYYHDGPALKCQVSGWRLPAGAAARPGALVCELNSAVTSSTALARAELPVPVASGRPSTASGTIFVLRVSPGVA